MKKDRSIEEQRGYLPPQAISAEETVIGGMLIDSTAIDEVLFIIKSSEVFYKEHHKLIFEAIVDLTKQNIAIDIITVSNQLRKNGTLDVVGGEMVVVQLSLVVSSTANIEHHCRIILQQWVKRSIISISNEQIRSSYSETIDVFDLLADAEKGLDTVNEMLSTGANQIDFNMALQKVVERVEMLTNQQGHALAGVPTGFRTLDNFTGGWQAADLVIVAARPGMGKTSFILKNILEIAKTGEAVGMFSLEMSIEQLTARLVAINSEFHLTQLIKKGFEHDRYFTTLLKVQDEMKELPIFIDDNAGLTIHQLQMKARLWKRKHNITALFVDYIQLMSGDSNNGNREQEIAVISRKLKQIGKELKIPVIALSQLSRAVETRGGDKRPRLSDLRESGAIEQDADTVIFIYRPEYYGLEIDADIVQLGGNTEISFAKYRSGSLETKSIWWQGDKTKFMDVSEKVEYSHVNDSPY